MIRYVNTTPCFRRSVDLSIAGLTGFIYGSVVIIYVLMIKADACSHNKKRLYLERFVFATIENDSQTNGVTYPL